MELTTLRPAPHYVTHIACLRGCTQYLGRDVGEAWLFGGTGYAFMMNIPREVHCMGPTAWDWTSIADRTPNFGIRTDRFVSASITDAGFVERQREARRLVCDALSAGLPCYGCELGYPEFFTIHACDAEGIRYRCCWEPDECSRAWCELGTEDVGRLFVGVVERAETADDEKCVEDALAFALRLNDEPPQGLGAQSTGLNAYDVWIEEMESGRWKCDYPYGLPHNAAHWAECRSYAAPFLREAGRRLGREALYEPAARNYALVAEALATLAATFRSDVPYEAIRPDDIRAAVTLLEHAREAEATALDHLQAGWSR